MTGDPTVEVKWGDANVDGKVDLSDAVAVLQFVALPKKYALTPQGEKNADVFENGSGISGKDALVIQMVDAKLVSEETLPLDELPSA